MLGYTMQIKILCVFLSVLLISCQQKNIDVSNAPNSSDSSSAESATHSSTQMPEHKASLSENNKPPVIKYVMWQEATVKYFRHEGGFYGLISKRGDRLLPVNLGKKYQQDGAIIAIKGAEVSGVVSIVQWGRVFKISDVKLLKQGRQKVPDNG